MEPAHTHDGLNVEKRRSVIDYFFINNSFHLVSTYRLIQQDLKWNMWIEKNWKKKQKLIYNAHGSSKYEKKTI